VLVADDSVMNQKVITAMLAKLGHSAEAVANGREAVAAVEGIAYDVVLMDCQMPEMDGFEATRAIRARERSGSRRVVILALTGSDTPGDRERCLAAGMDDYLTKPVSRQVLQATIECWLAAPRPAGDAAAADPEVDAALVAELKTLADGEEPAFLAGLLGSFVAEGRKRVRAMQETARAEDRRALLHFAHAFKGSATNLAASRLARLCGNLETELRKSLEAGDSASGSAARWTACVDEIAAEFARACPRLEALFGVVAA
jgi:CheY-like chemotaxis protein/HPt (histidine-containing phosphotransfer) domain-containing protein